MEAVPPFSLDGAISVAASPGIRISLPPDAYSPYSPSIAHRGRRASSITPREGTEQASHRPGTGRPIPEGTESGEGETFRGDAGTGFIHDHAWQNGPSRSLDKCQDSSERSGHSASDRGSPFLSTSSKSSSTSSVPSSIPAPRRHISRSHRSSPRVPPLYDPGTPGPGNFKTKDLRDGPPWEMSTTKERDKRSAAASMARGSSREEDTHALATRRQQRDHGPFSGRAGEEETEAESRLTDQRRASGTGRRHATEPRQQDSSDERCLSSAREGAARSTHGAVGESDGHVSELFSEGKYSQGTDVKPRTSIKELAGDKEKRRKPAAFRKRRGDFHSLTSADEDSSTPFLKKELRHLKKELREKKKEVERLRFEAKYISIVSGQDRGFEGPLRHREKLGSNSSSFVLPAFEPTASSSFLVGDHLPATSSAQLYSALSEAELESLQRRADKLQELLNQKTKLLTDLQAELQEGGRSRGAEYREILRLKEDLEKQRQELVEKDALIRSLESDRETLSGELAALKGSALCQSADIERLRRQGEDDFRQAAQTRFRLARENEHLRESFAALERDHGALAAQFRAAEARSKQLEGEIRRLEGAWHAAAAEAQMKSSRLTEVEEQLRTSRRYVCYLERLIRDLRFFLVYEMETQQAYSQPPEAHDARPRRGGHPSVSPCQAHVCDGGSAGYLMNSGPNGVYAESGRLIVEQSSQPELRPVPSSSWQSPPVSSTALARMALGAPEPVQKKPQPDECTDQGIVGAGEDRGKHSAVVGRQGEARALQEQNAISGHAPCPSKHQIVPAKEMRGKLCETGDGAPFPSACSESHGGESTEIAGASYPSTVQELSAGGDSETRIASVLSPIQKLSGLNRRRYELERLELRLEADSREIDTALRRSVDESFWDSVGEVASAPGGLTCSGTFFDISPGSQLGAHGRPTLEGADESFVGTGLPRNSRLSLKRRQEACGPGGLDPITPAGRTCSPEGTGRCRGDANAALLYLDRLVERASRELAADSRVRNKCSGRPARLSYPAGHAPTSADTPVFGLSSDFSSPRLLPPLHSPSKSGLLRAVEESYDDAKVHRACGSARDQSSLYPNLSPRGSDANSGGLAQGSSKSLGRLPCGRPQRAAFPLQRQKLRFTKVGAPPVPRRDHRRLPKDVPSVTCVSLFRENGGLSARAVSDYLDSATCDDAIEATARQGRETLALGEHDRTKQPWHHCGRDGVGKHKTPQLDYKLPSMSFLDQPDPPPVPSSLFTGEPNLGCSSRAESSEQLASRDELLSGLSRPRARVKCQAPPPVVVKKGGERVLNDGAAATLLAQEIRRLCPSTVGKSRPVMIAAKGMGGTQLRPRWKAV